MSEKQSSNVSLSLLNAVQKRKAALEMLTDSASENRIAAVESFAGSNNPEARLALSRKLSDRCFRVRLAAVEALGSARPNEAECIAGLVSGLCDWNPKVRIACARALTGISTPEAIAGLYEGLRDPEREFRLACAEALEPIRKAA